MFFQNTVIKKYLAVLNDEEVRAAWETYKALFLNQIRQDNIHASKEEQFQEGFLRDLFVKTLGYTINPDPDYNLITEKKNETDSKKADGAILRDGKVIGVIELKDHKTPNLKQVETQAFGYKNNHKDTRYVIISNFEKLRFYIDNAVEFDEWDLFSLSEEEFRRLYFCLSWGTLSKDLPIKAKTDSISNEDRITQQLYRDYSAFKREVFADILMNNTTDETPKEQKLLLFKKTQKLLDRLLFIFFAEDCELLPPNMILQIIGEWEQLKALDVDIPLYTRIKQYFGYLDAGNDKKNIYAYNGGLFKPDEELDKLIISDELLALHTRKLSEYDYESEVDVNILGHIFENSLSEIEEVSAQINAGEKPSISKRKRDGVFYTPQYITKYIVENTVGKLCAEKKAELGIDEAEYFADKNRQMATKKRLLDKLDTYREWLKQITICDPACGSGAFLNAALQFLMAEHKLLDDMVAKVAGYSIVYPDVENYILENNLYGVDINEESVEIARLALWLRTAKRERKLSSLNNNIKCGNSLISDPEIAGEKAFNWQEEFPQVFAKGGFDVVIGNPPYVHLESINETSTALAQTGQYKTYNKRGDLYCIFVEKGFQIAKEHAFVSYIMPNKWMQAGYGKELREFMLSRNLKRLIDFGDLQIFEGATTYPCIFIGKNDSEASTMKVSVLKQNIVTDFNQMISETDEIFALSEFTGETWVISSKKEKEFLEILSQKHKSLSSKVEGAYRGVLSGLSEAFLISDEVYQQIISADAKAVQVIKPFLQGRDISAYTNAQAKSYLILFEKGFTSAKYGNNLDEPTAWNYIVRDFPSIAQWLEPFAEKGRKRTDKGEYWWELRACDYYAQFEVPKIIYQVFQIKPCFLLDESGLYCNNSVWFIPTNNKALLAILNSRMGWWLITKYCSQIQGGYQLIWKYFGNIPIPVIEGDLAEQLSSLADKMLSLYKDLQAKRARFLQLLQNNLPGIKITNALETFDTLDFAGFVAELKKQKIKLSLSQQDEWLDFFDKYKTTCEELKSSIATTDKEINSRVYDLYGLTEEERKLIEE